jgi:hypothetical protein
MKTEFLYSTILHLSIIGKKLFQFTPQQTPTARINSQIKNNRWITPAPLRDLSLFSVKSMNKQPDIFQHSFFNTPLTHNKDRIEQNSLELRRYFKS